MSQDVGVEVGLDLPFKAPYPPEPDLIFDRFARLVSAELDVPVSLVSFVDVEGQNLAGAIGLPEPWLSERWTPLSHSFCQHVVTSGRSLIVTNANDDPRVAGNLAIMELGVIAYAGFPVRNAEGAVIGSLCAIDHRPREWSDEQVDRLGRLADALSAELARRVN